MMPRSGATSFEVLPPSRGGETAWVVRAGVAILVVAMLWIGSVRLGAGGDPEGELLPYQVRFTDLEPADQRGMRELHEGAIEALRLRGDEGRFPDVARLASEGVPPFADDGVDRGRRRWTSASGNDVFQYLGLPSHESGKAGEASAPALLLQFLPGDFQGSAPRESLIQDEQHRWLPDGTQLHVLFWVRTSQPSPEPSARDGLDGLIPEPARSGWKHVISGTSDATAASLANAQGSSRRSP